MLCLAHLDRTDAARAVYKCMLCYVQALQTSDRVATDKLEQLSEITATPTSQLKFVLDAWAQVVDCRRILKWTYAFGYYRFGEGTNSTKAQQEFFEFSQVSVLYHPAATGEGHSSCQCFARFLPACIADFCLQSLASRLLLMLWPCACSRVKQNST